MFKPTSIDRNDFDRSRRTAAGSASWVAWLPLVFVGAMMFWTVALGLGGASLMKVSQLSVDQGIRLDVVAPPPSAIEPMPMPATSTVIAADGIVVRLQESPEPQDAQDTNAAAGMVAPAIELGNEAGP